MDQSTTTVTIPLRDLLSAPIGTEITDVSAIGTGGFATVFKAHHKTLGRTVAIKLLHVNDEVATKRIIREAKILASIQHPNIITVYSLGLANGRPYLVMEYLDGQTLADLTKTGSPLAIDRVLSIMRELLAAVVKIHDYGIVHRDLSLANCGISIVEGRERAKLFDFGLVKPSSSESQRLTLPEQVCATPLYMSPEQCVGQEASVLSDVYSLGCVFYHLYAGRPPFIASTVEACMRLQLSETAKPLFVAREDSLVYPELEEWVAKAMSKNPSDRFPCAQVMLDSLPANPQARPDYSYQPPPTAPKSRTKVRPKTAAAIAASLGLLAAGVFVALHKTANHSFLNNPAQVKKDKFIEFRDLLQKTKRELQLAIESSATSQERKLHQKNALAAYQSLVGMPEMSHTFSTTDKLEIGKYACNFDWTTTQFVQLYPQMLQSALQDLRCNQAASLYLRAVESHYYQKLPPVVLLDDSVKILLINDRLTAALKRRVLQQGKESWSSCESKAKCLYLLSLSQADLVRALPLVQSHFGDTYFDNAVTSSPEFAEYFRDKLRVSSAAWYLLQQAHDPSARGHAAWFKRLWETSSAFELTKAIMEQSQTQSTIFIAKAMADLLDDDDLTKAPPLTTGAALPTIFLASTLVESQPAVINKLCTRTLQAYRNKGLTSTYEYIQLQYWDALAISEGSDSHRAIDAWQTAATSTLDSQDASTRFVDLVTVGVEKALERANVLGDVEGAKKLHSLASRLRKKAR